jgi:hypothetical protein
MCLGAQGVVGSLHHDLEFRGRGRIRSFAPQPLREMILGVPVIALALVVVPAAGAYYLPPTAESYPDITARTGQATGDIIPAEAEHGADHGH